MNNVPVTDKVLAQNIYTTMDDVYTLLYHSDEVGTRAKTVYYKTSALLLASVVEALVYHYIERCSADNTAIRTNTGKKRLKKITKLGQADLGTSKHIWLTEEVDELNFSSTLINSKDMNEFCLHNKLVSHSLFRKLEYSRTKRNQIHLQTLDTSHRSYNAAMVDRKRTPALESTAR